MSRFRHAVGVTALAMIVLALWGAPLGAATYYVDVVDGNDSTGDGSLGDPWQTLGKAEDEATGGDVVYLREGTYPKFNVDNLQTPMRTDYLTFKAYPGEAVLVQGVNLSKYWSQSIHTFNAYIAFEDVEIYDATEGASVVRMDGSQYARFTNCEIHGEIGTNDPGAGSTVYARDARYLTIENCELHDSGEGVMCWSWNVTIKGCAIYNMGKDGVQFVNAKDCLLEDCDVYNINDNNPDPASWHNDGVQMWTTASGPQTTQVPLQNITIRRCHFWNIYDQGFMFHGSRNTPTWDDATGIVVENVLLEASLSSSSAEVNVERTEGFTIRNSTFPNGWIYINLGTSVDIRNTICKTLTVNTGASPAASSDYNDYNVITSSISGVSAGSHSAVGVGARFVDADNADFHLQPDSPAVDAGTSSDAPSADFDGSGRVDTTGVVNLGGGTDTFWDIGCFEYQGSAGGDKCATISESHSGLGTGSGTVTVTAAGYYELVLKENQGGRIAEFYDLTADPSKTRNLAVDSPWTEGMFDMRYLQGDYFLLKNHSTGRTLDVVFADERRVVVKVSGNVTTDVPFELYYTFHAPIYEGSFIDLDFYCTNETDTTLNTWYSWAFLRVAGDSGGYTFDWQGSSSTNSEPQDRWLKATTGPSCDMPNVAVGRSFKMTELTFTGTANMDNTPPSMSLRTSPQYINVGDTRHERFRLEVNIEAEPRLFTVADALGTGGGKLTVTCPKHWELVMDEAKGGGIREFYDLRVDRLRQVNLASQSEWSTALFDARVSYGGMLHKNQTTSNDISLETNASDEVVARVTGTMNRSGLILDFTCDYAFFPPDGSGTAFGVEMVVDNDSGGDVPSSYDFTYLHVSGDPGGATFDWQGSVDSDQDDHWLRATVGANATVSPITTGLYFQLQELSYGNIVSTDSSPSELSYRFGAAAIPDGQSVTRQFVISTNIAEQ